MPYHTHPTSQIVDFDLGDPSNRDPGDVIVWNPDTGTWEKGRRNNWRGQWVQGTYYAYDQVLDSGWLMIANKTTTDKAAPQIIGTPEFLYSGTAPTSLVTAKQVVSGNRYQAPTDIAYQIGRIRVYTVVGNIYRIFYVEDPLGAAIINELLYFVGSSAGWVEFAVNTTILPQGGVFDLAVIATEPDPTPTTFTGNWFYNTPNITDVPTAGNIIHATRESNEFRIHKVDGDLQARGPELEALNIGDIIDWGNGGTRWAIQSVIDNGTWMNLGVSPTTQESPDGTRNFTFETTTANPVTRVEDVDYWATTPPEFGGAAQGFYVEDGGYGDIVVNNNAYGVDIQLQRLGTSDDWEFQSLTGESSSAAAELTRLERDWISASAEPFDTFEITTTDNQWTTAFVIEDIPVGGASRAAGNIKAVRTDATGYYVTEYRAIAANTGGGIAVDETQVYELGPTQLAIRVQQVGLNAEVQVRGIINQDWNWTGLMYFSPM